MARIYRMYDSVKIRLKRSLPFVVLKAVRPAAHWLEVILANFLFGFAPRGMKFIGVTGTNGKTTTAILVAEILRQAGYTVGLNSTAQIGVGGERWDNDLSLTTANPFLLHKLLRRMRKEGCDWVVMEVSSHSLVQRRLWGIKFTGVVFTNLGRDHLDYHKTMQAYANAKGRLFSHYPRLSVLNRDDEWYEHFAKYTAEQQISFGTDPEANCRITQAKLGQKGTKLDLQLEDYKLSVNISLPGKHNSYDALAAASTAYGLGISLDHIKHGLERIKSIPGRMELIDEGQDFTVFVDFSHTQEALEALLKTIRMTLKGRLITVVGADGDRDSSKRKPLGETAARLSEVVVVTDQEPHTEDPDKVRKAVLKGAQSVELGVVVKEIEDRREAIRQALRYGKKGDVVAVVGMGNQPFRMMPGGRIDWDERDVTRSLLKELKRDQLLK